MIAAGFGLRRSAGAEELAELLQRACTESGLSPDRIDCLATLDQLADHPAIQMLKENLKKDVQAISKQELSTVSNAVLTRSDRIQELYGVGSVAEAAALIAAGSKARLRLPRIASASATCALAEGVR
ncbi:cobalamin biosynthesis protein [Amorphus orientalis]|uniref:Cobalt-precorrin 5A hydrolase n=1 Tax=Amorphus orientalis TaxID=649198 RepID=A0AAE3VP38_9HYPH|nr:cobalamin biosynthesis protein [Amorphus orientalis]MDQ0315679.1 cobalt-precorrin 5A hydrolase [Amorphus orientalis]